jgi:starch-binding outer membrane protein, SusD/RagB family
MKRNFISKFFVLLVLATSIACESYTEDVNIDPNNFTDAPGSLVIGQAMLAVAHVAESQTSRYTGIFTDQFSGCDRQFISYENYNLNAQDFDDTWGDIYADGIGQAIYVEEQAVEDGTPVLEGVAQIMQAFLFGEATALFGDVPFSEAGKALEFPNPKYDAQASILSGIQSKLDAAITNVGESKVSNAFGASIFVNNDAKWKEVAYSLKARFYLIAKDYPNALTAAQKGISSPAGNLETLHTAADGQENLYWQFIVEQRAGYIGTCNSPLLMQFLDGTKPRKLATPGDSNRLTVYYDLDAADLNVSDGGYFAQTASFPIISWTETKLIEAEAAARTSGDGLTPFNEVRANLATVYGGDFPASTATGDELIAQILEEKYISLFGSTQVFHDVRRTNNAIGVPIKSNTASTIPQRFLYPQVEINANQNYPGSATLFTPIPVNN